MRVSGRFRLSPWAFWLGVVLLPALSDACIQTPRVELDDERAAAAASKFTELKRLRIESSQAWGFGEPTAFTLQFETHAQGADGVELHYELLCWPRCLPPIVRRGAILPGQSLRAVLFDDIGLAEAAQVVAFVQSELLQPTGQYTVRDRGSDWTVAGPLPIESISRDREGYRLHLRSTLDVTCNALVVNVARGPCKEEDCPLEITSDQIVWFP